MGNIRNSIKRGNIELEIPSSWSKRKTKWVVAVLLLFAVAFGMLHAAENNPFLLSLCIFSTFIAGQLYFALNHWDLLKKEVGKCIFLKEFEDGYCCTQGYITAYEKKTSYEPACENCKRKTVLR